MLLSEFGFNLSGVRKISVFQKDSNEISNIISRIFYAKLFLIFFGFFIYYLVVQSITLLEGQRIFALTFYLIVAAHGFTPVWAYQGLQNLGFATFMVSMGRIISLILIFILIKDSSDIIYLALIQGFTYMLSAMLLQIYLFSHYSINFRVPSLRDVVSEINDSTPLFFANMGTGMYGVIIIFLLGIWGSPIYVAMFSACEKIILVLKGLISSLSYAVYPMYVKIFSNDDVLFSKNLMILIRNFFYPIMILIIILTPILWIFSKEILTFLYGPEYAIAQNTFRVMIFTPPIIFIGNLFGIQFLLSLKKDLIFRNILLSAGCVCICILYFFSENLDDFFAATTVLVIEIYITILFIFYGAKHVLKFKHDIKFRNLQSTIK
jgi:PST family polysaccharide transporter